MRHSSPRYVLSGVTRFWLTSLITCVMIFMAGAVHASESAAWSALKSGNHFALLRHAKAPGTGDPENFELGNCSTQRNLSDDGRNQAAAIGAHFRANDMSRLRVFSSQWCRCQETATLLGLGPVRELAALNSFFRDSGRQQSQTQQLRAWLASQDLAEPILLVTHQVNITALTGVYPASGELIIVRKSGQDEFIVVGRIRID